MILADTSVMIDYARGKDAKLVSLVPTLQLGVCGVVRAELLCGARSPQERSALLTLISPFQVVPIPEPIWDEVGDALALLRSNGLTVSFQDAVLAALAVANDLELWTRDTHFKMIQPHLPALKLFQEPP